MAHPSYISCPPPYFILSSILFLLSFSLESCTNAYAFILSSLLSFFSFCPRPLFIPLFNPQLSTYSFSLSVLVILIYVTITPHERSRSPSFSSVLLLPLFFVLIRFSVSLNLFNSTSSPQSHRSQIFLCMTWLIFSSFFLFTCILHCIVYPPLWLSKFYSESFLLSIEFKVM